MSDPFRPRRSALYLPASNAKALAKARSLPVDVVILDLEDAVAPERKAEARDAAAAAVKEGGFGSRDVVIRVNAITTPWGEADLAMAASAAPNAVLAPKVDGPNDINAYNTALLGAPASVQLWAMIETCRAIPALPAIAAKVADSRLATFVMGINDLAKEMRAKLTPARTPFLPAMAAAVQAGRSYGLTVLDGVCNEFHDEDIFRAETAQGVEFGFDGKTLIHPAQIAICNELYSPSAAEIAWADAVIAAFALPDNQGRGAISVEGKMTELLHLEQARRIRAVMSAIEAALTA